MAAIEWLAATAAQVRIRTCGSREQTRELVSIGSLGTDTSRCDRCGGGGRSGGAARRQAANSNMIADMQAL
jgi:hypothetical protein